jgi:hypothetical protein
MPNMLLQKIPYAAFTATAKVRFVPNKNKKMEGAERAGLIVTGRKASFTLEAPVTDEWCYLRLKMTDKQKGSSIPPPMARTGPKSANPSKP